MRYQRRTTYYPQTTHELNLPAGWSCPHALGCLTKADRDTGRLLVKGPEYRCYATAAERFPSARDSRWANYDSARRLVRDGSLFPVPARATHVRIHGSGDFYSQAYLDRWLDTAAAHPHVTFWAFTKSLPYWVARLDRVPDNLTLNASYGGKHDHLITEHGLKSARVYHHLEDVPPAVPIDTDDTYAMRPGPSFALLENYANRGQAHDSRITEHNARAAALLATA